MVFVATDGLWEHCSDQELVTRIERAIAKKPRPLTCEVMRVFVLSEFCCLNFIGVCLSVCVHAQALNDVCAGLLEDLDAELLDK